MIGKIFKKLNIIGQCRDQGVSVWQCPQFLFLMMGLVIIVTSIIFFLIGTRYIVNLYFVALLNIFITLILFIISFIITRSFERLSEVVRMKSEFVNIVSHQLMTPITNIKWITDFLTSKNVKKTPKKKEEYFSQLKRNIERMVELVDNLLLVSRIEKGSFPIRKRKSSLEDLIKDLINRSKVFADAFNIKIKFYPQNNLPKSFFDPTFIKLVVENLIDNAIRYSKKEGKIEIWLEKKKNFLYFKIKDKGVGIPKADHKYIFQKFFRSENAIKEQTEGSGLGLYIAKSIIKKSKGKIWFESEEMKGTTFYFTLPIK